MRPLKFRREATQAARQPHSAIGREDTSPGRAAPLGQTARRDSARPGSRELRVASHDGNTEWGQAHLVELRGIRTPDLLHAIRNQPAADRSHMPPDQQPHSPGIARCRPASPVACSPLAPLLTRS
jgi:hypothetical protein